MRKQTKLVAVLSAAALLAIGASMTSFAAAGWQEENGQWYYYNANGDYVVNDWKKSGNNWFWLGEDGAMVTDSLVEDGNYYYYVNANGAMVTNAWVAVAPGEDDYEDNAPDHYWYYFGSNGKAYRASDNSKGLTIKTINGKKYGFGTDSKMVYGFVTEDGQKNQDENPFVDAMYYFGTEDDGAMHTGWLPYTDGSDLTSGYMDDREYSDMDEMWFYFKPSNGQMIKSTNGEKLKTQSVNGNKYGFDENGVMVYDWTGTDVATKNVATESGTKFFSEQTDGHLKKKTWIYAVPTEEMDAAMQNTDNEDETSRWFYADATGKTAKAQIKSINGKKYLFNAVGEMESGLQWVWAGDPKDIDPLDFIANEDVNGVDLPTSDGAEISDLTNTQGYELYYFSGDGEADGSMKTGKNIKIDLDDDTYTFGFKSNGIAYNYNRPVLDSAGNQRTDKDGNLMYEGLVSNKIYKNGILQKATSDERYKLVNGLQGETSEYLVGTSGTIVGKKKYVKDGNDDWWAVTPDGTVVLIGADDYADDIARCTAQGKDVEENINQSTGELRGYKCVDNTADAK